ncbi:HET-domain-containing protein [Xylaria curta]|nr:HET-domain-containing protein [Xylaria curta]
MIHKEMTMQTSTTMDHFPPLILDRPCTHCRVLEPKDSQGRMQHDQHGKPYVEFRPIAMCGGPRIGQLKLGYWRNDVIPSLPKLAATALQGCAFCKVLREDLISAQLWNKQRTNTTRLTITEVTYHFREIALYVYFTIHFRAGKTEHSLHYNLYTYSSDPCAQWFRLVSYPVVNERLSTPSLDRMKILVDRSLQESPIEDGVQKGFLPTRLLDLESDCTSGLRLVTTKNPEVERLDRFNQRHAALSYCWGPASEAKLQLKTTQLTLDSHLVGIQLDKVPKTISDAIRVCRCLSIRYLWVDALCIIQEDEEDWNKESFEMSQIYSNCFLALCVIQGDSCSSGFLEPLYAPPTLQINFQSQLKRSISGCLYLRMLLPPDITLQTHEHLVDRTYLEEDSFQADLSRSAWSKRGWTFQEDQLSPRKLYFGERMFYISSGTLLEAADGSKFHNRGYLKIEISLREALSRWYIIVEEYTKRKFSSELDRFPAIAALARSIRDQFPDQKYLAGFWESDLHRGLLWTTLECTECQSYYYKLPSSIYIAPSWSWACRPYTVKWIPDIIRLGRVKISSELVLNNADILSDQANPYGRVSRGRLSIRGKVFKPPVCGGGRVGVSLNSLNTRVLYLGMSFIYILRSEKNEYIAHIHLDWDYHSRHNDEGFPRGPIDQLSLLLVSTTYPDHWPRIRTFDLADQDVMLGILIRPVSGIENEYEKLGIWYAERDLCGERLWENVSMQELILV